MNPRPARLAVLFADISKSTRLYEQLGDQSALRRIDACLSSLRRVAQKFEGRTVKTIGDAVMCVFPSADAALQAASEMQVDAGQQPSPGDVHLAIRVAFHFGDVIEEDGDVFGDTVNVAARLAELAKAEQILTSQQTVDALTPYLRLGIRRVGTLAIKGRQEDAVVCEVIWQFGEDLTMMEGRTVAPSAAPSAAGRLQLDHGARTWVLGESQPQVSIGRDTHNDVVVADRMASRQHARIERRRDKFVLVDVSTNGTFVTFDGMDEVTVKREELLLRGSGVLSFGQSAATPGAETVRFSCA